MEYSRIEQQGGVFYHALAAQTPPSAPGFPSGVQKRRERQKTGLPVCM